MRRTCFEFLKEIGWETGLVQDLSITSFDDNKTRNTLLYLLNKAKEWVSTNVGLNTLQKQFPIVTIASYSTGTVSTVATSSTVTGVATVFTSEMVGRKIRIGSDATSYLIRAVFDPTHLEIETTYPLTAQSGVSYTIFQDVYELPPDCSSISTVQRMGFNRTLDSKTIPWLTTRYADPLQRTGEPLFWGLISYAQTWESGTAQAGTSADELVVSGLTYEDYDGYYEGWYVYNTTVRAKGLVAYYNAATLTMQLRPNIIGQAAGDTFSITKRSIKILLRPTPLSAFSLVVTGFKDATLFSLDTDYENEIDGDYEDILVSRACAIWFLNKDEKKYASYQSEAEKKLEELKDMNSDAGYAPQVFTGGEVMQPGPDVWYPNYSGG